MAQFPQLPPGGLLQQRLVAWVSLRSRRPAQQRHLQPRLLRAGTVRGVHFATEQFAPDDDGRFGGPRSASVIMNVRNLACVANRRSPRFCGADGRHRHVHRV